LSRGKTWPSNTGTRAGVPTNLTNDTYRLAGVYAGRILDGAEPGESLVMPPARFELVINDRTAKALRIAVPRRLLSRADEIID
jgi:putative ABC transport system substrate-binding protein